MEARELGTSSRARTLRLRHGGLLLILLVLGMSACATTGVDAVRVVQCPPSIAAPSLEAGDMWSWTGANGETVHLLVLRKTDEGLVEALQAGVRVQYDNSHSMRKVYSEGVWLTEPTPEFPLIGKQTLVFPLHVGKTWTYQVLGHAYGRGDALTFQSTYAVVGCGTVKVPAGEFFAVAIEESQSIVGMQSWGKRTLWYAPDVKNFIKLTHGPASPSSYWASLDSELVYYAIVAPSQSPATAPGPATSGPAPPK